MILPKKIAIAPQICPKYRKIIKLAKKIIAAQKIQIKTDCVKMPEKLKITKRIKPKTPLNLMRQKIQKMAEKRAKYRLPTTSAFTSACAAR